MEGKRDSFRRTVESPYRFAIRLLSVSLVAIRLVEKARAIDERQLAKKGEEKKKSVTAQYRRSERTRSRDVAIKTGTPYTVRPTGPIAQRRPPRSALRCRNLHESNEVFLFDFHGLLKKRKKERTSFVSSKGGGGNNLVINRRTKLLSIF